MKRNLVGLAARLVAAGALVTADAGSVINQVDGTVVPQNYAAEMQLCLNRSEGAGVLDAVFDADIHPEIYLPVPGVQVHFVDQAEGAGYTNSFGWYNVGDDVSNPANLFTIFPCRTTSICPCDSCGSSRWRHQYVNISASANYKGGYIGFWLRSPERLAGGSDPDNCGAYNDTLNRIYYTQKVLNDDGDYVHFIVYTSVTHANTFYFGFEDLFRGGDNDFEDMFVFVDGLVPLCVPRVEVCDNRDNDCDGATDEGLTIPCATVCGDGVRTCTAGSYGACSARTPTGETCNDIDDNCDGETDEGLSRGCGTICEEGTEYCVRGAWVDCSARLPGAEVCNAIDDDCDGAVDEGNPGGGARCGTDVGVCEFGVERCVGGAIICSGGVGPTPEVCNGRDDDCDGPVDEGDPGGGGTCGTNEGECTTGTWHCTEGSLRCTGATGPVPETCNNRDDDCDGSTDEGNPGGGDPCGVSTGECEPGVDTCRGGTIQCIGGTGPTGELCDGLDNNCDGVTDEGNPGGGATCGVDTGECRPGVLKCDGGALVCWGEIGPAPEECNLLDDDCDGATDEDDPGGGGVCGSDVWPCVPGVWHCIAGTLVCEGGIGPVPEVCNGIDDDCDGATDEGNPGGGARCGTDVGECEPGITWCSSSEVPPPCPAPDPLPDPPRLLCLCGAAEQPEVCDCLDNDCNGSVDDGLPLGEPCGVDVGECHSGFYACIECGMRCSVGIGPSPEVCDCLDNDCNGSTDDGDICGGGICYRDAVSCYCALPCNPETEFPCPTGKICVIPEGEDGYYCLGDPCAGVDCPDCTQRCVGGECVDKCGMMACGDGQACVYSGCSATCVPSNCYAPGFECPEGQRCEDAACVPDPCAGKECGPRRFCRDGECFDSCTADIECRTGYRCYDGECVEDKCGNKICTGEYVCNPATGECEKSECLTVQCLPPLVCEWGRCVDPPCLHIRCPEGFVCEEGSCYESVEAQPVFVTTTGGGGCSVAAAGAGEGGRGAALAGLALALAGIVAAAARRRRRALLLPGALLLLAAAALPGCHREFVCLENCDALTADGEAVEGGDAAQDQPAGDAARDPRQDGADGGEGEAACNPLDPEQCNGLDDNCNGLTDEGIDLTRDPNNCGACGNVCGFPHAFAECRASACVMTGCDFNYYDCAADDPGDPESLGCETLCFKTKDRDDVCNYRDDDCNCRVDDLVDLAADPNNCGRCGVRCNARNATSRCESPDGTPENAACVITGCAEGYWDHNGVYNDGCEYECARCQRSVGACEPDKTCCTETGGETCNGLDDDCDHLTDEDNPGGGDACGTDEGECTLGTTRCDRGELVCDGGAGPADEACDGRDNDCDGATDEGDPGGGAACGSDEGECAHGVEHCLDGSIVCTDFVRPLPESCNNRDDDCDGITDDGNPEGGAPCGNDEGACVAGTWRCVRGSLACTGGVLPADEVCDGLDNDCDRSTDEGDPGGGAACGSNVGACRRGVLHCTGGNVVCTGETPPSPERCNGVDDDCDGTVDDGNPEGGGACGSDTGECVRGTLVCTGGKLDCTGETPPSPERCNGLDDDCDGPADEGSLGEGVRCGSNRGTCEYGTTRCVGGTMRCQGAVDPVSPEPCDGLDNDCDGTVDNHLGTPTVTCLTAGVCAGTAPTCTGTTGWKCLYPSTWQASEAWCDGLNNDCDASTDEGCPVLDAGDKRLDLGSTAGAANSTQIDVATDGAGLVHVVYIDRRTDRADIYYNRSTNGGLTWLAADVRLDTDTAGSHNSVLPAVAHGQGDRVFAAWSDFRASTSYRDVYEVRSTNDGGTWSSPDTRLDTGLDTDSFGVDIAADILGGVYIVFENLRADRSRRVYLVRSLDGGSTWAAPVRIDHNPAAAPAIASLPQVAADNAGSVIVVWRDNRHGKGAIYANYSLDRGVTWQAADTRLDTDTPAGNAQSDKPKIAADSSGNVFVAWEDLRNGYVDVYANSSNNRGATWKASDTRLDRDPLGHDSFNPVIAADTGGRAWVAWEDQRNGFADIYLNMTTNGGTTWLTTDTRLDTNAAGTAGSYLPSIDAAGSFVVVGWQDGRNGTFDIYANFSLDAGASFQPADFRVDAATTAWDAVLVEVAVESGRAHFVWVDYRNGSHRNGDIYVRSMR